jgi:hypothetical protein
MGSAYDGRVWRAGMRRRLRRGCPLAADGADPASAPTTASASASHAEHRPAAHRRLVRKKRPIRTAWDDRWPARRSPRSSSGSPPRTAPGDTCVMPSAGLCRVAGLGSVFAQFRRLGSAIWPAIGGRLPAPRITGKTVGLSSFGQETQRGPSRRLGLHHQHRLLGRSFLLRPIPRSAAPCARDSERPTRDFTR